MFEQHFGTCPQLLTRLMFPHPCPRAQSTITLQWRVPQDNGSPVTAYRLERDDGTGGTGNYQFVYAGPGLAATAEGLRSGLKYSFRLLAENDVSRGRDLPMALVLPFCQRWSRASPKDWSP